jgi:hypothetical protein
MKENELIEVQKLLSENLFYCALPELGFQLTLKDIDDTSYKKYTSVMYKLHKSGVLDTAECNNFEALAIASQAIPNIVDFLNMYPNTSLDKYSLTLLSDIAKNMQLYLALYERDDISIAEDILPSDGPKDFSIIAAGLKVQASTLRNTISAAEVNSFTLAELKNWLEKQEKFVPYKKVSSVSSTQPFDFSFIRNASEMLYILKFRCNLMGKNGVWAKFEKKHYPDGAGSANAVFADFVPRMERLYKVFSAANLKTETIEKGLTNVRENIKSEVDLAFSIITGNFHYHLPDDKQSLKTSNTIDSKELKDLLKNQNFSIHPSDRGRNKKMSGMQKGNISLAIENLKTPQVWVCNNDLEIDMLEGLVVSQYEESVDGTGRHSGLRLYEDLAIGKVMKVKIDSLITLNKLLGALKPTNLELQKGK